MLVFTVVNSFLKTIGKQEKKKGRRLIQYYCKNCSFPLKNHIRTDLIFPSPKESVTAQYSLNAQMDSKTRIRSQRKEQDFFYPTA